MVIKKISKLLFILPLVICITSNVYAKKIVRLGLNCPSTGPYSVQGLDQIRAAKLAVEEINADGGILGRKIKLFTRNSQSKVDVSKENIAELIDKEGVQMVFGGSSSAVAIASGKVCRDRGKLFFGTLTYSNATTGKKGQKYLFRECNNAWMAAKAIADYLKKKFSNKKYFYITADYTWGWSTEESVRKFTKTKNKNIHKRILTPFPGAKETDFRRALKFAELLEPDVLVLVLFGNDMVQAVRIATSLGLKNKMQIVVPSLTLGMADSAGAKVMEGVIGTLPWTWQVPYVYNYKKGKEFVRNFSEKYKRYPSASGASAYTILYEYKSAVERAKTFNTKKVIKALEGHKYKFLKDMQIWRKLDHQSLQTVYTVKCKPWKKVIKDKFQLDYFEIVEKLSKYKAARSTKEWKAIRKKAGEPAYLEPRF
jgi:branched-chain amino acid transport system substrate-binding protein